MQKLEENKSIFGNKLQQLFTDNILLKKDVNVYHDFIEESCNIKKNNSGQFLLFIFNIITFISDLVNKSIGIDATF